MEMTSEERQSMMNAFRDVYRDATGCRPSAETCAFMRSLSDEAFERAFISWEDRAEYQARCEAIAALKAQRVWEQAMARVASENNVPFSTAVRWDMQANGADNQDAGYYCYKNGLDYSLEERINRLLTEEKRMAA